MDKKNFAHTLFLVKVNKQFIADKQATFKVNLFKQTLCWHTFFTKLSYVVAECRFSRTLCLAIHLLISGKMCVFLPNPKNVLEKHLNFATFRIEMAITERGGNFIKWAILQ